jgi:hypothetical protein
MSQTEIFNRFKLSPDFIIRPHQKSIKVGDSIACLVQWDFKGSKPGKRGILKGTVNEVVTDKGVKPSTIKWDLAISTYAEIDDDGNESEVHSFATKLPSFDVLSTIFGNKDDVLGLRESPSSKFVARVVYKKKDASYTPPTTEDVEENEAEAAQEAHEEASEAEKKAKKEPDDAVVQEDAKAARKLADASIDIACSASKKFDKDGEQVYNHRMSALLYAESKVWWVDYWRQGVFSNHEFRYVRKHPTTGCIQRGLKVDENTVKYISDGESGKLATSPFKDSNWNKGWDDGAPSLSKKPSEAPPASTKTASATIQNTNVESGIQSLRAQLAALTLRLELSGAVKKDNVSALPAQTQLALLRDKIKRTGSMIESNLAGMRRVHV